MTCKGSYLWLSFFGERRIVITGIGVRRNSVVDTNVNLRNLNVTLLDVCRITGAGGQHIEAQIRSLALVHSLSHRSRSATIGQYDRLM